MELFTYDVNCRQKLYVGRETDHRTKAIRFSGFKRSEPENAVYLKLDEPIKKMIPLTDDYAVEVTQLLTDKARDIRCQLVEMHEEDGKYSFIRNSAIFYASVAVSVPMSELAEVTDPRLELAYQMMYQGYVRMTENGQLLMDEYQEIKEAFDSGALNGKDGYTPQKNIDYFDGKDGYSPVKGKDYFTAEEVEAIEVGASEKALERTYTKEVIDKKIEDAAPKDYDSLKNEVTSNSRHLAEVDAELSNKVEKEDGKGLFSGNYNDLTNKPTIPPQYNDTEIREELTEQKEDLAKLDRTTLYIDPEGYICLKESE